MSIKYKRWLWARGAHVRDVCVCVSEQWARERLHLCVRHTRNLYSGARCLPSLLCSCQPQSHNPIRMSKCCTSVQCKHDRHCECLIFGCHAWICAHFFPGWIFTLVAFVRIPTALIWQVVITKKLYTFQSKNTERREKKEKSTFHFLWDPLGGLRIRGFLFVCSFDTYTVVTTWDAYKLQHVNMNIISKCRARLWLPLMWLLLLFLSLLFALSLPYCSWRTYISKTVSPNEMCDFSYRVYEESYGKFCINGAIEMAQFHWNWEVN